MDEVKSSRAILNRFWSKEIFFMFLLESKIYIWKDLFPLAWDKLLPFLSCASVLSFPIIIINYPLMSDGQTNNQLPNSQEM